MSVQKRRRKAILRRKWVTDLRELWDLRLQRLPGDCISVTICPCGTTLYLREGATSEDRESYDNDVAAHDYCDEMYAEVTR